MPQVSWSRSSRRACRRRCRWPARMRCSDTTTMPLTALLSQPSAATREPATWSSSRSSEWATSCEPLGLPQSSADTFLFICYTAGSPKLLCQERRHPSSLAKTAVSVRAEPDKVFSVCRFENFGAFSQFLNRLRTAPSHCDGGF